MKRPIVQRPLNNNDSDNTKSISPTGATADGAGNDAVANTEATAAAAKNGDGAKSLP